MMRSVYLFLGIVIAAGIFFTGCSVSKGTTRYDGKSDSEDQKQTDEAVRYNEQSTDTANSIPVTPLETGVEQEDELEDYTGEVRKTDLSALMQQFESIPDTENDGISSELREKVIMQIIAYFDVPYKYGGNDKDGIDCSAFTKVVLEGAGLQGIHRTARDQYTQGSVIEERSALKFGDLVFFNTRRGVKPGHVGIYISGNLFAHASRKLGVIVSSLDENYYNKRYMGARRFFSN